MKLCFNQNNFDSDYYYLVYENKRIEYFYFKKFYEIISEDKILNIYDNININNNIILYTSSDNLDKTNISKICDKEKIMVLPINEKNERKIEIEIKIVKKCCCVRLQIKISNCCDDCRYRCNHRICPCINKHAGLITCCSLFLPILILFILRKNEII